MKELWLLAHQKPARQGEAKQSRVELERAKEELGRQASAEAALKEFRRSLKAGQMVKTTRFDKLGKVVRIDLKKSVAAISLGLGQWEVPLDEVFPAEQKSL